MWTLARFYYVDIDTYCCVYYVATETYCVGSEFKYSGTISKNECSVESYIKPSPKPTR